MNDIGDVSEATLKALEAFLKHARTQHKLMRDIPVKPMTLGRGYVEMAVTMPEPFTDGEVIHGGLYSILLDTILAVAAWSKLDTFQPLATINLKTDFFTAAKAGEVLSFTATCRSVVNDVAFCQGSVTAASGDPVAQADGTFMVGTSAAAPTAKGSRL